ncbi:MAG: prepilin-type N-terminal cleavage/methylation domain-containing protein [Candidatus Gracilibacteria bacterium]|nr:prepilin-type N-terminal cleavage/methylation domain-containing protein [Candidatus Gracilibacteria bacterium]
MLRLQSNKKAFTFVELIVVVVIISILSLLGFVSYQRYTEDARDGKRKSSVAQIAKVIELKLTNGATLFNMVADSNSTIADNIQISGYTGSQIDNDDYISGNIKTALFDIKEDTLKDPLTDHLYQIGVTKYGNRYEVAAGLELRGKYGITTAGTWNPRKSSTARVERESIDGSSFYMSGVTRTDISLKRGDLVQIGDGTTLNTPYKIIKIGRKSIVVDRVISPTGQFLFLDNDETRHLVKKHDSDFAIDDKGAKYTPYKLN